MNAIERLKELLEVKKSQELNLEDKQKVEFLESVLKDKGFFLKIKAETAFGILEFLEVSEEEAKKLYFELISPQTYIENNPKQRVTIIKN